MKLSFIDSKVIGSELIHKKLLFRYLLITKNHPICYFIIKYHVFKDTINYRSFFIEEESKALYDKGKWFEIPGSGSIPKSVVFKYKLNKNINIYEKFNHPVDSISRQFNFIGV